MIAPSTICIAGVISLLSKEYLTRKTTPRKSANPPIHAKSLTPMNASQSIAGFATFGAAGFGGGVAGVATGGGGTAVRGGGCGVTGGGATTGGLTGAVVAGRVETGCGVTGALTGSAPLATGAPDSSAAMRLVNFCSVTSSTLIWRAWTIVRMNGTRSAA